MSHFNRLIYFITRLLLLLGGLIATLAAILFIIYFLSGTGQVIRIGNITLFDMTEWSKGIPARAHAVDSELPDSILLNTGGVHTFSRWDSGWERKGIDSFISYINRPAPYTDTLHFSFESVHPYAIQANALKIETFRAYVKPTDWIQQLYLFLPFILNLLLAAWSAWQLSRLVQFISKGNAFRHSNHRRIANIGYAILLVHLVFLVLHLLVHQHIIEVKVNGTWMKDQTVFRFFLESPFNIWWVLAGCLLLLVAKAWKDGMRMQEEQDFTL